MGGLLDSPPIQVLKLPESKPLPNIMDQRTALSSRAAKLRWLQTHRVLWEGLPPDDRQNWRAIIKLMKADGLVAQTTYAFDVNLPSLIADAYGQ
jgi:hypothetical protein